MSSNSKFLGAPLAIEVEIRAEKASAMRRVAQKVESLLAELKKIEDASLGTQGAERARHVARHQTLRAEAEKQRWYLIVQREAMGLYHHGDIEELYRLPNPLR
ncbi:hypothetical protein [Melittangium boletus]|uniref:Uncharacterized protein n=1 Tax=Melittangium boletus DSM 14713 TaxID=1294270 RepID=A0A250I6W6_9BACT|nr:hypothetical protein [Melittangium boletus]ATB27505.1 hypothetical protein MEBOL_000948 [Melittangium boletus DSM 14713]